MANNRERPAPHSPIAQSADSARLRLCGPNGRLRRAPRAFAGPALVLGGIDDDNGVHEVCERRPGGRA